MAFTRVVVAGSYDGKQLELFLPLLNLAHLNISLLPILSNSIDVLNLKDVFSATVAGEETIWQIIQAIPETLPAGSMFPSQTGLFTDGERIELTTEFRLFKISYLPRIMTGQWEWDSFWLTQKLWLYLKLFYRNDSPELPYTLPADEGRLGHFEPFPAMPGMPDGATFMSPVRPFTGTDAIELCIFSYREGYGSYAGLYDWSLALRYADFVSLPSNRANYPKHFLNNNYPPTGYYIGYEEEWGYWEINLTDTCTCYPLSDLRPYYSNLSTRNDGGDGITSASWWFTYKGEPRGSDRSNYPMLYNAPYPLGTSRLTRTPLTPITTLGGIGYTLLRRLLRR